MVGEYSVIENVLIGWLGMMFNVIGLWVGSLLFFLISYL